MGSLCSSQQDTCVCCVCRQLSRDEITTLKSSVNESCDDCNSCISLQHAIDAMSAGVSPIRDTAYNSSYWDVGSAFFFAGTVITTIGNI